MAKVHPNPGHHALAELEKLGVIKCVITQNIDNLHRKAGSRNVIEYHGNAFKFRCLSCGSRFDSSEFDFVVVERREAASSMPSLQLPIEV